MIKVNFTPKTDIEAYLNNDFNIEIFDDLTENEDWQGIFEPLEFFNLLYEQFEVVNANKAKPISVKKHLLELDLEKPQLYYFLHFLTSLIYLEAGMEERGEPKDKHLSFCHDFILKEYVKLGKELYPEAETEKPENKYDFERVKKHLETLPELKERIVYLIEQETMYKQENPLDFKHPNFGEKCELEIKKLKKLIDIQNLTVSQTKKVFQLRDKKGVRTDLIRILNAVYELKFFEMADGQIPSKEVFMKQTGEFFGLDLSKYDSDLSQSFNNTSLEANLKIFEQMKEVTQKSHHISTKEK